MKLQTCHINMVVLLLVLAWVVGNGVVLRRSKAPVPEGSGYTMVEAAYREGVNDGVNTIALLSLEQQLEGTNRVWEAMAQLVCSRLGVDRIKVGAGVPVPSVRTDQ